MPIHRHLALCALALAATAAPLFAQANSGSVVVTCGNAGGDLQRAIDNVPADSTIVVNGVCAQGPYYIRKSLHLVGGSAGATLSGTGDRVVDIIGANVRVERLTIDATDNAFGILIEEGSSGIVDQIVVRNAEGAGLQAMLASYAGVTGSTFTNNVYGIFLAGSSSAWLDGNVLDANRHAHIAVYANSAAYVYNSQMTNGNIGVLIERMSSGDLSGNLVRNNTGPGLLLSSRISNASIGENTIQANGPDVRCDARALLIVDATQTSSTSTSAIDPGCVVEGGPIF